jgi:hypothetical protein
MSDANSRHGIKSFKNVTHYLRRFLFFNHTLGGNVPKQISAFQKLEFNHKMVNGFKNATNLQNCREMTAFGRQGGLDRCLTHIRVGTFHPLNK